MSLKKTLSGVWACSIIFIGFWFFLIPFGIVSYHLKSDDGLSRPGGSSFAFSTHKKLSKRYEKYAERRVASGVAASLPLWDIAGTEWPLFGSVFYLWSTVHLQEAWENDPSLSKLAPKVYGRGAIEAATALVLDEGHAAWVKAHWGDEAYLETENVFYRMLVMWAVISNHKLTGGEMHFDLLRSQVESFSAELEASPYGLLDDYPNQCYPTDVTAALAAIRASEAILGSDYGGFLDRSIRGFEGKLSEPFGLPPYAADSRIGVPFDRSRGCGNSYFCSFAPLVWPERA